MNGNFWIYFALLGQLVLIVVLAVKSRSDAYERLRGKRWIEAGILCICPLILVSTCMNKGNDYLQGTQLQIVGYNFEQESVTVGSSEESDLILSSILNNEEQFASTICTITNEGDGRMTVRLSPETAPQLPDPLPDPDQEGEGRFYWHSRGNLLYRGWSNIVSLSNGEQGYRLGAVSLGPGDIADVTLVAVGEEERDIVLRIFVEEDGVPKVCAIIGDDRKCEKGAFGKGTEILGLRLSALSPKTMRMHLRFRVKPLRPLLGEASIMLRPTRELSLIERLSKSISPEKISYDFEPNGLPVRLNGEPLPLERTFALGSNRDSFDEIWFSSRDLGLLSQTRQFNLRIGENDAIVLDFPEKSRPRYKVSGGEPLGLSSGVTPFATVSDIIDPNFPEEPVIIFPPFDSEIRSTQGTLEFEKPFWVGNARAVLTSSAKSFPPYFTNLAMVLVLVSVLAFPLLGGRMPLNLNLANGAVVMLCALRLGLAVRVWAAPPLAGEGVLWEALFGMVAVQALVVMLHPRLASSIKAFWQCLVNRYRAFAEGDMKNMLLLSPGELENRPGVGLAATFWLAVIVSMLLLLPFSISHAMLLVVLLPFAAFAKVSKYWVDLVDRLADSHFPILVILLILSAIAPQVLFGAQERWLGFPINPVYRLMLVYLCAVFLGARSGYFKGVKGHLVLGLAVLLLAFRAGLSNDTGVFILGVVPILAMVAVSSFKDNFAGLFGHLVAAGAVAYLILAALLYFVPALLPDTIETRLGFAYWPEDLKVQHFVNYISQVVPLWHAAQSTDLSGAGLFQGFFDYGIRNIALSDYVPSVWILGELGLYGVLLVAATLLALPALLLASWASVSGNVSWEFKRTWLFCLGLIWVLLWPTVYMFLANFQWLPLTGKDLPFLALNALGNPVFYGLVLGLIFRSLIPIAPLRDV